MILTIETSKRKYFRQMLELLKSIPPISNLTKANIDVLAELLYYNYMYKNIDIVIRHKILFDYETKVKIREFLNINAASLDNIFTSLRKKGFINSRGLVSDLGIDPDKRDIDLLFKFKIND